MHRPMPRNVGRTSVAGCLRRPAQFRPRRRSRWWRSAESTSSPRPSSSACRPAATTVCTLGAAARGQPLSTSHRCSFASHRSKIPTHLGSRSPPIRAPSQRRQSVSPVLSSRSPAMWNVATAVNLRLRFAAVSRHGTTSAAKKPARSR